VVQVTKWLCIAALVTTTPHVRAAEVAGVAFAQALPAEASLVLHGLALKEATFLGVDVYAVALYAADGWTPGEDAPASLAADSLGCAFVVHFLREIGCRKLADSWVEDLARACEAPCDELLERARALARKLPDVRSGDRITYRVTRAGVAVRLDDEPLGTLAGEEAARSVAAAFLGPRAPKELRKSLLAAHVPSRAARPPH